MCFHDHGFSFNKGKYNLNLVSTSQEMQCPQYKTTQLTLLRIIAEVSGFDVGQLQTLSIAMMKERVRYTEGLILTGDNVSTQAETCPSAYLSTTNPTRKVWD